jgi:citronellol/citronellal dehydrogenase
MTTLSGRTMFISGASRGIGLAIAKRAAADGANVALMAKTDQPHPKLEGTVHTAAAEIEGAGGRALPIVGDIRHEDEVTAAVAQAADCFGGIDLCVNNASAIALMPVADLPVKRYHLMQDTRPQPADHGRRRPRHPDPRPRRVHGQRVPRR